MNKHKIKAKNKQKRLNKTNVQQTTITGQPTPLTVSFEQLRERALKTPMLNENFVEADVNLKRHSKVVDYNSSFILAVIVLVVFQKDRFIWLVQSCFVSKTSGNMIKHDLLTFNQRSELKKSLTVSLADCGDIDAMTTAHTINSYVWNVPFAKKDYESLDQSFQELIK